VKTSIVRGPCKDSFKINFLTTPSEQAVSKLVPFIKIDQTHPGCTMVCIHSPCMFQILQLLSSLEVTTKQFFSLL
jgi:hypothetical protein